MLTYHELRKLTEDGVIAPVPDVHINGASIDVTLGRYLWIEDSRGGTVDLATKKTPGMIRHDLVELPYALRPGEFTLAQTHEMFNLPNDISAEFRLKSSVARAGLDHALAGWADPGWHDSVLTLELRNNLAYHRIVLRAGMKVGQMIFHRGGPVPDEVSYAVRGHYNGDTSAQPSRGMR